MPRTDEIKTIIGKIVDETPQSDYVDELEKRALRQLGKVDEALRLMGFAYFNLSKGKTTAAMTLLSKAMAAVDGDHHDSA